MLDSVAISGGSYAGGPALDPRIPLPMPFGWFRVCDSDDLKPGELESLHYLGRELVAFRGDDGVAHVLDAYCPHLGAHLGHGGTVEGDSVRCPFHGWRWDGAGRCVEIPYAKRIPRAARLKTWTLCEKHDQVFVWYHPHDEPPRWEIPDVPEWGSEEWTAPVRVQYRVRSHPQEMAENVVDPAHFHVIHGTPHVPEAHAEIEGHIFRAFQGLTFSTPRGEIKGRVDIENHGGGFGVSRFRGVVETLLMVTGAPVDEGLQETTIRFVVKKIPGNEEATRNVGKAFVAELERQYTQDIPIWEHKIHLARPLLCDGDGPIALLRRYYRQFYAEPPAAE